MLILRCIVMNRKAMKKIFTNLRKFLRSNAGFLVMLLFVLSLFVSPAIAGIKYIQNQIAPAQITTKKPLETTTPAPTTNVIAPAKPTTTQAPSASNPPPVNDSDIQCTTTSIPYETIYQDSASMDIGTSNITTYGVNGVTKICTGFSIIGDQTYSYSPTNEIIEVGTRPIQTPTITTGTTYTYAEAYSLAVNNCNAAGATSNTSAYGPCIAAYLRKYGY